MIQPQVRGQKMEKKMFTVATGKTKYLGINLMRNMQNLLRETLKNSLKDTR